jgi:alkylation response protein AidB-like acyl-CoA dehydrogenase
MDAVGEARAVGALVRAQADAAEAARRLPGEVVAALAERGLLRMAVPAAYDGPEVAPLDQLAAIEEVSFADGAAGWCVAISTTTSSLSWFLAPEHAKVVFADPQEAYGGAFAPTGRGRAVEGGWTCDGRWAWGSGTPHCAWITGGCTTDTGEFHLMFFSADQVTVHDDWDPVGLRGTGSNDYEVSGAFVPEGRSVRPGVDRHAVDCALARFPNFTFLAASVAAVTLGVARRAVDELVALATVKTPALTSSKLAEHPPAQLAVAGADAAVRAARALLVDEVGRTWDLVVGGDRVPVEQRARVRLACAHAADAAATAVDLCQRAAGGSAVPMSSPLARCFRDVHTATQHLMLGDRNALAYGRLRFGLDVDTATL